MAGEGRLEMGPSAASGDETRPELRLFAEPGQSHREVARIFDSARLAQARVLAGLTRGDLAAKLGISGAALGQYETGAMKPRQGLLPELSRILEVPVEYFAVGRPIGRLSTGDVHFRSIRSTRAKDRAKAAAYAEQLWELTYALEKRVRFPDVDLPSIGADATPAQAAHILRKAWEIGAEPVRNLVTTMESRGIVISLVPGANESVARLGTHSTGALGRPIVIVTPDHSASVYRIRFNCAHELGHLLLHTDPLPGDRQQEREADEFAVELLTPESAMRHLLPHSIRYAALARLSTDWGVSVRFLVRRMGELSIVSDSAVRQSCQHLSAIAGLRRIEPITVYKGEVPSMLRKAFRLAEHHGLSHDELATELCWSGSHLSTMLGEDDQRPVLHIDP